MGHREYVMGQHYVPMRGLDELRVLERATGQLREGLAVLEYALSLHLESALLRHRRVPTNEQACVSGNLREWQEVAYI